MRSKESSETRELGGEKKEIKGEEEKEKMKGEEKENGRWD